MKKLTVKDIESRTDLMFISDGQDVDAIKEYLGNVDIPDSTFGSFFVKVDGENALYSEVYGMRGVIPFPDFEVWKII